MFYKKLLNKETFLRGALMVGFLCFFFLLTAPSVRAQIDDYAPLAPLPGLETTAELNEGEGGPVANYFSTIYQIGISLVLVFAVVMLIYGGIQYMTSDSIGGKSGGRETIGKAIIGIVLAVSSYALLFLIGGAGAVTVGFDVEGVGWVEPPPRNLGSESEERYCQVSIGTTDEPHNSYPRCPAFQGFDPGLSLLIGGGEAHNIWIGKEELTKYFNEGGGQLSSSCRYLAYEHPLSIDMSGCEAVAASEGLFDPGTPQECFNSRLRSRGSLTDKQYFCGIQHREREREQNGGLGEKILFKLNSASDSGYDNPGGSCFQVDIADSDAYNNERCMQAGNSLGVETELRTYTGTAGTPPGDFCVTVATDEECANIEEGPFVELFDLSDEEWDRNYCDIGEMPKMGIFQSEQQKEFLELADQFLGDILTGASYQTSGYYTDQYYHDTEGLGSGSRWHTGIDIGVHGQGLDIKTPVTGQVYIMRTSDYSPEYARNGKIAIIERLDNGEERAWVYTHIDNFDSDLQNGDIIEMGTEFAQVGIDPCFPSLPDCDGGTHLDLNVYTHPDLIEGIKNWGTNNTSNWSNLVSGRHGSQAAIAEVTMCPFHAYWESVMPSI